MFRREEVRLAHLSRILTPDARKRLSRLATVRAERARAVEDFLIQAATSGRLRAAVGEADLVKILEQVDQQESSASTTTVKVSVYLMASFSGGYLTRKRTTRPLPRPRFRLEWPMTTTFS